MQANIFVINLERRPDRREEISTQLERAGMGFTFVNAVDGLSLEEEILLISPHLDRFAKACWLSHAKALDLASRESMPSLILEDDARLPSDLARKMESWLHAMNLNGIGLLQVGFCTGSRSPIVRVKEIAWVLLGRVPYFGKRFPDLVQRQFGAGTHAYIVTSKTATVLKKLNQPPALAADAFLAEIAEGSSGQHAENISRLKVCAVRQSKTSQSNPSDIQEMVKRFGRSKSGVVC